MPSTPPSPPKFCEQTKTLTLYIFRYTHSQRHMTEHMYFSPEQHQPSEKHQSLGQPEVSINSCGDGSPLLPVWQRSLQPQGTEHHRVPH